MHFERPGVCECWEIGIHCGYCLSSRWEAGGYRAGFVAIPTCFFQCREGEVSSIVSFIRIIPTSCCSFLLTRAPRAVLALAWHGRLEQLPRSRVIAFISFVDIATHMHSQRLIAFLRHHTSRSSRKKSRRIWSLISFRGGRRDGEAADAEAGICCGRTKDQSPNPTVCTRQHHCLMNKMLRDCLDCDRARSISTAAHLH